MKVAYWIGNIGTGKPRVELHFIRNIPITLYGRF